MRIRRQMFRKALWLTCCMSCLTAFSPLAAAQTSPAENPPVAAAQADAQQESQEEQQQEQRRDEQGRRVAESEREADGRRVHVRRIEGSELAQPRAWLGIGLKEVSGDLAAYLGSTDGVLIETVFPDSPAESAGLKVGDLITEINGEAVANPRALIEALVKLDSAHSKGRKDRGERVRKDAEQKEDPQKEDAQKGAEQKKDVQRDEKEGDKPDDDQQQNAVKKNVTFAPVKLTLMRQGKQMTVEVTPTERPESAAMPDTFLELSPDGDIADVKKMLEDLQSQGSARVFRFGPPSPLAAPGAPRAEEYVANLVIVVKDENGSTTEVHIDRVGKDRPKITVREGDKTREISEKEIDQLPPKVREEVRQALERQEQAAAAARSRGAAMRERIEGEIRERIERGQRELQERARQHMEANRRMREQSRERSEVESHITIFSPEELRKLGQSAQELAAKYQELAEEMAERGVEQVQELAAIPDELKELRAQVDELKKQVEELKAQAKAED